ncbi:hypothetical protein [Variovorax sp. GB1P17]|uniref:hypothetical protein n=1 Tax=Variovorax sp. GB1P17 TaxID=3443740 RepID=UPI003F455AA8
MSKTTHLIPQATSRTDDSEVLAAIEKAFAKSRGSTSNVWTLGVRNVDGIVYREVLVNSLDQLPAVSNALAKLGFAEEMDEEGGMIDGYDATFRKGK